MYILVVLTFIVTSFQICCCTCSRYSSHPCEIFFTSLSNFPLTPRALRASKIFRCAQNYCAPLATAFLLLDALFFLFLNSLRISFSCSVFTYSLNSTLTCRYWFVELRSTLCGYFWSYDQTHTLPWTLRVSKTHSSPPGFSKNNCFAILVSYVGPTDSSFTSLLN